MLEQLQAMDPGVLLAVVRQDQRDPNFILRDWTVGLLQVWGAADLPGRGQAPAAHPMLDADPFQEGRAEAAAIVCPQREVHPWTVRLLSEKGAVHPEGLWCFSGHGQKGD